MRKSLLTGLDTAITAQPSVWSRLTNRTRFGRLRDWAGINRSGIRRDLPTDLPATVNHAYRRR